MIHRRTSSPRERGYSLAEMLVVVAIIGLFSLVAVPQFMNINRSMKMKASFRQFVTDIRAARQRAIAKNRAVAVQLSLGVTPADDHLRGEYEIWEQADDDTWAQVPQTGEKRLTLETTDRFWFESTTFANAPVDEGNLADDDRPDIVFEKGDGRIRYSSNSMTVVLKTDYPIAKHTYTVTFYTSGAFTSATN